MIGICADDEIRVRYPEEDASTLALTLGCSRIFASVLQMRGLGCSEKARAKHRPGLRLALEELFLGNEDPGGEGLRAALREGVRVVVYGDYDVDGVAATSLAVELCLSYGAEVRYYIPHRRLQGYGIHEEMIGRILQMGCDLLLVVDCGTRDRKILEGVVAAGVPVWVFDHHLPEGPTVRDVGAVLINPHASNGDEEGVRLCATGVLWAWLFRNALAPEEWLRERLDLVALATVADCVSLGPLNRALVFEGLERIRQGRRVGLRLLAERLGLVFQRIGEEDLAMKLIPCLNAAGRLDLADVSVRVLLGEKDTLQWVERLVELNRKRQYLSGRLVDEISTAISAEERHVLRGNEWPVGILSSVASRLCSQFRRPIALAAPAGEVLRGTLRVPGGVDAVAILRDVEEHLLEWGGHRQAAGFSVAPERWNVVEERLEYSLSEVKIQKDLLEVLAFPPQEIDMASWREVETLGPFGMGNPRPLLYTENKGVSSIRPLGGNGRHVTVEVGGVPLLGFNAAKLLAGCPNPRGWVYAPRIDHWRGQARLQFVLERIVHSGGVEHA